MPDSPVQLSLFRRTGRAKKKPPIERRTHIALADLLRTAAYPSWLWLHVPNGEFRTPTTAALLSRMGVKAGAFDFLLIGPDGTHYWLELKRGLGAPLSAAQKEFRAELVKRHIPHAVAYSFDDAVAWLRSWKVLRELTIA